MLRKAKYIQNNKDTYMWMRVVQTTTYSVTFSMVSQTSIDYLQEDRSAVEGAFFVDELPENAA